MKEVLGKFFSALSAKDYVQVLIIVALAVAYFNRSDKKDAERAREIASEICRQDRIKDDSLHRAEMKAKDEFYLAKIDKVTNDYIESLRGINKGVAGAIQDIKQKDVERVSLNAEINHKVNRNGRELEKIVKEKSEKQAIQ